MAWRFNPAPGWPPAPEGWTPPPGWQPDPSWPPAPDGWPLWLDDAAPATAPAQLGSTTIAGPEVAQPGLVVPGSGRSGLGAWLAFVVVLLLAVGGYLVWNGFRDDEAAAPAAQPTATAPEVPDAPAPEKPEGADVPTPELPDALELPDVPEVPVVPDVPELPDLPELSDVPGLPADLDACLAISEAATGWSLVLFEADVATYLAAAEPMLEKIDALAPPAGFEDAWATYAAGARAVTDHLRTVDPAASPVVEMTAFLQGEGSGLEPAFSEASAQVMESVSAVCS